MDEFINPNWHVILIHYPIGLLTVGLVIELLSFLWPRGGFRLAGRWMILLGALLSLPTLMAGIYAFRDVVSTLPTEPDYAWSQVAAHSGWSGEQWKFMTRHIWLNSSASVIFILVVLVWLGASDRKRRTLYWPLLLALIVGTGLMGAGAWHGGEAVYRYGTAVNPEGLGEGKRTTHEEAASQTVPPGVTPVAPIVANTAATTATQVVAQATTATTSTIRAAAPATTATTTTQAIHPAAGVTGDANRLQHEQSAVTEEATSSKLEQALSPLQSHMILAGFVVAFAIGALGLTLRRWNPPGTDDELMPEEKLAAADALARTDPENPIPPRRIFPARFWGTALLLALLTAVTGLWATAGSFMPEPMRANLALLRNPEHLRLTVHVAFGVSIVLILLILAIATHSPKPRRGLTGIFSLLLLVAVAIQIWLGILMLYDSHEGPLTGFNRATAGQIAPSGHGH